MDAGDVPFADALAFGWRDHGMCVTRNDATAAMRDALDPKDRTRLRWFGAANPAAGTAAVQEVARLASLGFAGVGELFPDGQGFDVTDRRVVAPFLAACDDLGMAVVVHASDPEGPGFPGRDSTTPAKVLGLLDIVSDVAPGLPLVVAHLGGGLPLLSSAVDVRHRIERTRVVFDTAACAYLYSPAQLLYAARCLPGRIVFGSDHPVCGIDRTLRWVREAGCDPAEIG
jgi:predicted TIM-barrel fold metal-dependent hydrolase